MRARFDAVRRIRGGVGSGGDQRGVTLIELLIALTIGAVIAAAATGLLVTTLRTTESTTERVTGSASAFQTNARFVDDVRSATPIDADLAVARGQAGCGGDSASLLRALVRSGSSVQVRSYSLADGGKRLERRVCSGADLATALAAAPEVDRVASDLAGGADAPAVTCRANAGADPAPATPAGDEQCRIVTLDVKTAGGYTFTLEGHRDSNQTPVVPDTDVKRCTLLSSADTWISSYGTEADTNYGRRLYVGTFLRGSGEVKGLLKVDLLGPCTGPGEPAYLPGGKRLLSADLQLWLQRNSPAGTWDANSSGVEADHALKVIGNMWYEDTITWKLYTSVGLRAGATPHLKAIDRSKTGSAGQPILFDVLDEAGHWYEGDWPNYGWELSRSNPSAGDSGEDQGFHWASRDFPLVAQWPKLTVTWQ